MAVRVTRHRFTAEEFHRMAKAGILKEDERVELLEGEILEMAPIGDRHAQSVRRLINLFTERFGRSAIVDVQNPVRLSQFSEPQPDLVVLRPRSDFYATHPGPQDLLLVVEVADTTAEFDRQVKVPMYARAGVTEVWLVDLEAQVIEVYRQPLPSGYQEVRRAGRGSRLSLDAVKGEELAVEEVLG